MSKLLSTGRQGAIALMLFVLSIVVTGCGPTNPTDEELDRIPNVPPSSRSSEGGVGGPPAPSGGGGSAPGEVN